MPELMPVAENEAASQLNIQVLSSANNRSDGITYHGGVSPPLPELNIGQLITNQSSQHPERVAIVSKWQNQRVTYKELNETCRDVARSLLFYGVRPKDHVVVLAGNMAEYTELFLAVGGIGAVFSIIIPTCTKDEVLDAVRFLEPTAIFIADRVGHRKNYDLMADLTKASPSILLIVRLAMLEKGPDVDILTWDDFIRKSSNIVNNRGQLDQYWAKADPDDTLCVQFTSGTTGPRKAAMLTHRNLLGNALLVGHRLGYTARDVICCCPPLFHCFALVTGILSAITYGAAAVIPAEVFLTGASLEALSEDRCSVILAVATMVQAMLDHPEAKKHSPQISLRTGIVAGSNISPILIKRLDKEFGFKGLTYGYGMTEASCMVYFTDPSKVSLLDDHTSVGTLLPHSSARVVDSDLNALPLGQQGELVLSGYLVFKGYYKNKTKTEEALFKDFQGRTWLRTGDLVRITADGRCTIEGRVKDMIKRGGDNIFPSDVEGALLKHADIAAAACIGVLNDYWGETVGVFLQRQVPSQSQENTKLQTKDIKFWLRGKLAPHKMPEHFFWLGDGGGVPEKLPYNHTGKLMKSQLRDIANSLVNQRNS